MQKTDEWHTKLLLVSFEIRLPEAVDGHLGTHRVIHQIDDSHGSGRCLLVYIATAFGCVDVPVSVEITGPVKGLCVIALTWYEFNGMFLFHAGHKVV